jgi:hypothetical protein
MMISLSSPFNSSAMSRQPGRPVVRRPEQLQVHPALVEVGWTAAIGELNDAAHLSRQAMSEPILVTSNGAILAGFGLWRLATFEGRKEIPCIEYVLDENESLQFILFHYRSRRGWNNFVRIRLALTLEPLVCQKALDNMRAGGKQKGLANLPDLERIDVRQQIATVAGVGARNVGNVKTILQVAHPRIIEALTDGTLTINGAVQFCKSPRNEQLEQLIRHTTERATAKVIRQSLTQRGKQEGSSSTDLTKVLDALRRQEMRQPGSITITLSARNHSAVLIGRDLLSQSISQAESNLP